MRLKEAQDKQRARKEQAEDVREGRFQYDAQRVLQLKDGAILLKIKSQNERREKKNQKVKTEREKQRQDLLQEGKNPYEVWRREEMQVRKEEQHLRLRAQAELRSEKLVEQLIAEDKTYKRNMQELHDGFSR
ncbi:unnamed protein product [Effrenium voratum]|nr:unnamed protein product [Effrenium voratum]